MASKTVSMAMRLGARAASRAAVLPAKEASMGLRNLTTSPRHISSLRQNAAISISSPFSQRRFISERPDGRGRVYQFEDILDILESPSDSRLLIDVREPHEFGANSIPTAINIPITSSPDALLLSADEFQDQFGFAKPPIGKEMIFFCKAGVRSKAAASLARQAGYTNVSEYPGSWLEWEKLGGPGTHTPPEAGGVGEQTGPVGETSFTGGKTSGEEHTSDGVVRPPKGGQFGTQ